LSDQRTGLDYESGGRRFESFRARHFGRELGTPEPAAFALDVATSVRPFASVATSWPPSRGWKRRWPLPRGVSTNKRLREFTQVYVGSGVKPGHSCLYPSPCAGIFSFQRACYHHWLDVPRPRALEQRRCSRLIEVKLDSWIVAERDATKVFIAAHLMHAPPRQLSYARIG
jgi:hypothetical protein